MTLALDLDLCRTFVAVVDCGSFTRAAVRVNLTQSTVSQKIKKLETGLGHVLLLRDRADGGVRLTEDGEILLGYARRLIATAEDAVEALARPHGPKTVRLGVPEDFAGRRLIALLSSFSAASPAIRLDTVSGWSVELRRQLDDGEIDLALVKREAGTGAALASWPERLVWVGSASHALPTQGRMPLALFPAGCIYRDRAIRCMEKLGWPWHIAYASQGLMGVQAAVASGLGISLLPSDAVVADHRPLSCAEGFQPETGTELALVKAKGRLSAAASRLADFLMEKVEP